MYTLVYYLKAAMASKELIQVLLFIPLRRSDKQDKVSQSFLSHFLSMQQLGIQYGGLCLSCCLLGCYTYYIDASQKAFLDSLMSSLIAQVSATND